MLVPWWTRPRSTTEKRGLRQAALDRGEAGADLRADGFDRCDTEHRDEQHQHPVFQERRATLVAHECAQLLADVLHEVSPVVDFVHTPIWRPTLLRIQGSRLFAD